MAPTKFNHIQVALHWLTAAVLMFMLAAGTLGLSPMENSDPAKVDALRIHIMVGGFALVLILARIIWRKKSAQPNPLQSGNGLKDKIAVVMPYILNITALIIALSGISLGLATGLGDVVFGGVGQLPETFFDFIPRYVHGIGTKVLMALVVLHVLGGLSHVLRAKTFRMWFK